MKSYCLFSGFLFVLGIHAAVDISSEKVILENQVVRMEINRFGGAVSRFVLRSNGDNPYSWVSRRWSTNDVSRKEGLFICFDRVGKSSPADQAAGIPFHGEATSIEWNLVGQAAESNGVSSITMECCLPIAKIRLRRTYELFDNSPVCRISDRITNQNSFRKSFNVMQHPSIGPSFLNESVMADCNAAAGFHARRDLAAMPGAVCQWPALTVGEHEVDMRRGLPDVPAVGNYIYPPETTHGWGVVSNPEQGVLAGNLWHADEYPWVRVWREWNEGVPTALGVEFSTSCFGHPLALIEDKGPVLETSTIEYLDPGETCIKTFYTFLSKIPGDYCGTRYVERTETHLILTEHKTGRKIKLSLQ